MSTLEALLDRAERAWRQYVETGDGDALRSALAAIRQVVDDPAFATAPPATRAEILHQAGGMFHRAYADTDSLTHLEQAVGFFRSAVSQAPRDHAARPVYLSDLGDALRLRHEQTGNPDDLEEALQACQAAIAQTPADSPGLPTHLDHLGMALLRRYEHRDDQRDLERAIAAFEQSVAATPANSADRPFRLGNLGAAMRARSARRGSPADLDRAVAVLEEAVAATAPESPDRPMHCNNLGSALANRYAHSGAIDDLERACGAFEEAVTRTPAGWPSRPVRLTNLGSILRLRYERTGQVADLTRAIQAYEDAVAETPRDHPHRARYLENLGLGLLDSYGHAGTLRDLERAIEVCQEAVRTSVTGSVTRLRCLVSLGGALRERFARDGDQGDLEQAIALYDQAADQAPADWPEHARFLGSLGNVLRDRHAHLGDPRDLERAIEAYEQAVEQTPAGSPDLPSRLNNLGVGLAERHDRSGDLSDLDRALNALEQAVARAQPDAPGRLTYLNNLGNRLRDRYQRSHSPSDLDQALAAFEEVLDRAGPDSPDRPMYLDNLGLALLDRYQQSNDPDDLARALQAHEQAVGGIPASSPERPRYLSNLATCLWARYRETGDAADLDRAINLVEEAVSTTRPGSPGRAMLLNNLGLGLRDRHASCGDPQDLTRAIDAFRAACADGMLASAGEGLRAARNWGRWATSRQSWQEATEAYRFATTLAERLFRTQLLRADKEAWLREVPAVPSGAAYALAKSGDAGGAVLALERGRALLLSETLERDRADLDRLVDLGRGDLAARYHQAASRLQELSRADTAGRATTGRNDVAARPAVSNRLKSSQEAQAELDATIAAIREVPGYERFLDLPTLADLQAGVGAGPLVYLAATETGGLALVVRGSRDTSTPVADGISVLWLPGLTEAALLSHVRQFRHAHDRRHAEPGAWRGTLDAVTAWLWTAAMGPVLEVVGGASELAIIPGGLLGLLPLHAAWTTDTDMPTGKRHVLDALVPSYAPNARALAATRAIAARVGDDAVLAVQDPRPTRLSALPFAAPEVAAACVGFHRSKLLSRETATRAEVQRLLTHYTVHHLACHSLAYPLSPLDSALILAGDERLSLRDLLDLRLVEGRSGGARLAVLSACETQLPGTDLPDEVVSLPTGLLQAGLAGVVASQWAVSGLATAMLMTRFYAYWRSDGLAPVHALRQAQRWLRDTTNSDKASYFHPANTGQTGLPQDCARAVWREVVRRPAGERDFAHPVFWAPFAFVGA